MKMKKIFAVMLLMIMAFGTSALKAQSAGPIPVDDQVRIGKLDCGLTYYIRHNDYPEHRVNFYIAQRVGSIQEEESQRGLAHFLEHMASTAVSTSTARARALSTIPARWV